MADAVEWSRQISVRHREPGYLRLELPSDLCRPSAAGTIERGVLGMLGVYRVKVDASNRRLIVRHDAHTCTAGAVARRLFDVLRTLAGSHPAATSPAGESASRARQSGLVQIVARLQALRTSLREKGAAMKANVLGLRGQLGKARSSVAMSVLQARLRPVLASALTEKAVMGFLNDLLAFYLVKVHWDLISQRWLRAPFQFRYAWAGTFYLVFLLVRFRKQGARA